jgi:pimeloyl-ACP methyl ester carboxylesterase
MLAFQVHNPKAPGVPLLLTHGFGATAGMWDPNVDALSIDRPVIVWDQRGHGSSDAPDDMNRYTEQISIADMAAILDAAGADRAVLGGMSLGGYLSLAFYLVHPQRVAALVLVDTGPGYRNDEARDKWNAWVERRAQELERGQTRATAASPIPARLSSTTLGMRRIWTSPRRSMRQCANYWNSCDRSGCHRRIHRPRGRGRDPSAPEQLL